MATGAISYRPVVRVGVVSDTHGTLPDRVLELFDGVTAIVHAGDVGGHVLDLLRAVAPVTAVRGNTDHSGEVARLDEVASTAIGGVRLLVGHKRGELLATVDPVSAGVRVVVTGHTHRALIEESDGVLFLNPGSAGAPRDGHRATVALVEIEGDRVEARIVEV